MNHKLDNRVTPLINPQPGLLEAVYLKTVNEDHLILTDGRKAILAFGCLVTPTAGDKVLVANLLDATIVVQIISRPESGATRLGGRHHPDIRIESEELHLVTRQQLSCTSLGDMELNASLGTLRIATRNLLQTTFDSLVQKTRYWLARSDNIDVEASGLMRSHGKQQIFTADRDIRMDAERINMG